MNEPNPELQGKPISSAEARRLILEGKALSDMTVGGHLNLANQSELTELPRGLSACSLNLSECIKLTRLPDGLNVRHLNLNRCAAFVHLPNQLCAEHLELRGTSIRSLPSNLKVRFVIDLQDCRAIESLPESLEVDSLILRGCTALKNLPHALKVHRLDVSGCTLLATLPDDISKLAELNVSGCSRLESLPDGLQVSGSIELAQSGLKGLPSSLDKVAIRWRGVQIDERIAFRPGSFAIDEILNERNAESRRILIERIGYEALFEKANAEVLDCDRDAGGERRLLRVQMRGDEPLVCVSVRCPSTGRQYVLRVPPQMTTCRHAVAWIAGFDDPDAYEPVVET